MLVKIKKVKEFILLFIFFILIFNIKCLVIKAEPANSSLDEKQIKAEVERIYNIRSAAFVSGDVSPIKELFDTSQKYGKWALEHEVKRIKYLNDWANERGITLGNVESFVRIKKIYPKGNIIKIALEESYKFDYIYNNDETSPVNSFGVGIRHTTSIIKKNEAWVVYNDWYTDCFEDALQSYNADIPSSTISHYEIPKIMQTLYSRSNHKKYYDRQNAVDYADKYCGAAWGSRNNYKYNKKYNDYTGIGGDCTNFISQALADKSGGALPLTGGWIPQSSAWVNADGFKNYLLYSGKGSIIKIGTFKELTSIQNDSTPAISKLQLGDLVCYEKGRGNIDHFAIVTGFDCHGYPLINSHTTDRYHVPWDLGWGDKKIRFVLIHING